MFDYRRSAYNLLVCLAVSLFAVGCGGAGNEGSTDGSQPDAAQSQTAPEVPIVTLPDEDAGSSAADEGSNE